MDRPDWRSALATASTLGLAFLDGLPERPVLAAATAEQILAAIDRPVPEEPTAATAVLEHLGREADPGLTAMPSGRFFGWVIGGGLPAALGADWLTSVWDQNAGSAEGTPAAAAFEQVALRWVLELLDLPRGASGALVTGGQMANTVCLAAARHRVLAALGWDVEEQGLAGAPPLVVLVGEERHDTIVRSLRLLGLGAGSARDVAVDGQGALRPQALEARLGELGPGVAVIVCTQVGHVSTGAVDPVAAAVAAVERHRARQAGGAAQSWVHVDGAFGLWARVSAALRPRLAGLEGADSWATDAHKWPNTPYDCGIALCAHPEAHRAAMAIRAAYLPAQNDSAVRTPFDWTPELSRRARGFALYAALLQLGRRGMEALVDRTCGHARRFGTLLAAAPGVSVLNHVVLNQVLVRFHAPTHGVPGGECEPEAQKRRDDAHTRQVVRRLQQDRVLFASGTVWRGLEALRISVSNATTDDSDVDRSVAALLQAHAISAERPT